MFVNRGRQLSLVFLFNKTIGDILKKMKLSDVGVGKELEIIKNTASYSHTLWSNWSWHKVCAQQFDILQNYKWTYPLTLQFHSKNISGT